MFENMNNSKKAALIGIIGAAFAALFYFVGNLNSNSAETEIAENDKLAVKVVDESITRDNAETKNTEVTAEKVITTDDETVEEVVVTPEPSDRKED